MQRKRRKYKQDLGVTRTRPYGGLHKQTHYAILSQHDAEQFVISMHHLGLSFHWEDPAEDIISWADSHDQQSCDYVYLFNPENAKIVSKRVDEMWSWIETSGTDWCPFEFSSTLDPHDTDYPDAKEDGIPVADRLKRCRAILLTFPADQIHTEWMWVDERLGDPEFMAEIDLNLTTPYNVITAMINLKLVEDGKLESWISWLEDFTYRLVDKGWWMDSDRPKTAEHVDWYNNVRCGYPSQLKA